MPTIKANSINIYYETYGQGEPLILITGFSGDHANWQNIIEAYAVNYQVIVFDNRGIGKSDCPDYPYTIEMMADDVAALVQELKLDRAHIAGGSMGGCIVQMLAYKYPHLIRSAVISNSFPKESIRLHLWAQIRLAMMQQGVDVDTITKFTATFCYSQKYLSQPNMNDTLVQDGRSSSITIAGYKNQQHAMANFDSTTWLSKITIPCLVIAADDDMLATVEQSKEMANAISGAEYFCFHDVGHVPRAEQPELFNQIVLEFIAKHR